MNSISVMPLKKDEKSPANGLNHDRCGEIEPAGADPLPTLTRATIEKTSSITTSMDSSTFWKLAETSMPRKQMYVIATIQMMPTSSTQPLAGLEPMPSALKSRKTYWPAT